MSARDDGGPAFSQVSTDHLWGINRDQIDVRSRGGMSLRDYFAAEAMNALAQRLIPPKTREELPEVHAAFAEIAYSLADAMLEARKR